MLSCFVYSAFNVDKVRECHCCIIYIKILLSNNSFIPLGGAEFDDSLPFSGASFIPLCYVLFPATLPSSLIPCCDLFLCMPLNHVVPKFIYDTLSGILFSSILCT